MSNNPEQPRRRRGRPKKEKTEGVSVLNVEYPASLQLHRRGGLCKLDTGMPLKEQVAQAYDEWLTRRGYPVPAPKEDEAPEGGDETT